VLQITSTQHAPNRVILLHLKLNRIGGSTNCRRKYKTRSIRSTKKRPTCYKDTIRPQAIISNTEHICTTMFIRRRILRVLPFCYWKMTASHGQHRRVLHSPLNAHPHLEAWMNQLCQHVCIQRRSLTPRTSTQQHEPIYFTNWRNHTRCTLCKINKHEWLETGRTTKKYSKGLSVITHIIKSLERFLHFTSHLAFSHIMTEVWALFVSDTGWLVYVMPYEYNRSV